MNLRAEAGRLVAMPAILALLVLPSCTSKVVQGSSLAQRDEVVVRVRIDSDPPGALVTDLGTGKALGRTPLEYDALEIRFEEWVVINDPEDRGELLKPPVPSGEGAYTASAGRKGIEEGMSTDLVLRYRLEREGYVPLILSREIAADDLPRLQRKPRVQLRGTLEPEQDDRPPRP